MLLIIVINNSHSVVQEDGQKGERVNPQLTDMVRGTPVDYGGLRWSGELRWHL